MIDGLNYNKHDNTIKTIKVLTRAVDNDFDNESSDLEALERLMSLNTRKDISVNIKRIENLHAKVYVVDNTFAVVTSSNLTLPGFQTNIEFGVLFDDQKNISNIISQLNKYYNDDKAEVVTNELLEKIRKGVDKRKTAEKSPKPSKKPSKHKSSFWITPKGKDSKPTVLPQTAISPSIKQVPHLTKKHKDTIRTSPSTDYELAFLNLLKKYPLKPRKYKPEDFVSFYNGVNEIVEEYNLKKNKRKLEKVKQIIRDNKEIIPFNFTTSNLNQMIFPEINLSRKLHKKLRKMDNLFVCTECKQSFPTLWLFDHHYKEKHSRL